MSPASLAVQLLNGLASASSLFLIAAGLTLIFGVTRVVNFAHGSLYMLGAYVAWSAGRALSPLLPGTSAAFWMAAIVAALAVALIGALIEVLLLKRLYAAPELLQLTATFAVVLIVRDVALAIWGPEDRLGPRVPGLDGAVTLLGRAVPQYDLLLIGAGPIVLIGLTWLIRRTRFGVVVRAAAENRELTAALGIDPARLYTAVFALGSFLAGLAGALTLPRVGANLGMDLAVIAEAFVVTVLGGLGSIPGAFAGALLIGVVKALCIAAGTVDIAGTTIAMPKLTLVIEFIVMALVLLVRPTGLFGAAPAFHAPPLTAVERARVARPARPQAFVAIALVAAGLLLPLTGDTYTRVLATDILVAALFAGSLQLLTGRGGMTSFGHAAYFGIGGYAAAIAATHGYPFVADLVAAPLAAALAALAFGAICRRLSGIYFAMLTLAFAQIAWSIALDWDSVTGGSNGITGVWPPAALADPSRYYLLVLAIVAPALVALVVIAFTPFGYALRAGRDSPLRAAAIGIDVGRRRIKGLWLSGAFAGLAGGLYAYSKGGIGPDALAIPRSVDALVMMLIGGQTAWFGPLAGSAALTLLQDTLSRTTEYWRAWVGVAILALVLAFPGGLGGALGAWSRRLRRSP
ncbi:MAG: ABC transporter permease [Betaproteobacteria bacterium]|nr:ABC transporter permease [Betaproteobacteria bacterium]MDE2360896.1 ABC transporter permease [Betaproteobacteria bacterium]